MILVQLVPLERGFAPVRVPWVEKGDDYQIVRAYHPPLVDGSSLLTWRVLYAVFGDENNLGPIFTIGVDENAE